MDIVNHVKAKQLLLIKKWKNKMGDQEMDKCDFCKEVKIVNRTYLHPRKYKKPTDVIEASKLYNEGNYFIIVRTCNNCGEPTTLIK